MNTKPSEKKINILLFILICILLIGPLFQTVFVKREKIQKAFFVNPEIIKQIDTIEIFQNKDSINKLQFIKKENWFLRVGNTDIPVNYQFLEFINELTKLRSLKLVSKKIKDWGKYSLDNESFRISFSNNLVPISNLYLGLVNKEKNEIYFRGEKANVYCGEDIFSKFFDYANDPNSIVSIETRIKNFSDNKWLPTYLSLSRKSIQRISIQSDYEENFQKNYDKNHKDFTRILERILGSTGALVLDISSIKNQKPLIRIEIQNDDTKEYEILIFAIKNELGFQKTENEDKKEESFIVIPPRASYGLEISRWSIEQILSSEL